MFVFYCCVNWSALFVNIIFSDINQTPRTYCAANIEDTEFVIQHVKNKYPNAPLMGVGVSLGG